ncbi:hypothetical protein CDD83_8490 [Cordyceps sp. RAO-2017]|nr:hypothetical protein CDD83_8490 [Cordyceps sp. RAO-2017]
MPATDRRGPGAGRRGRRLAVDEVGRDVVGERERSGRMWRVPADGYRWAVPEAGTARYLRAARGMRRWTGTALGTGCTSRYRLHPAPLQPSRGPSAANSTGAWWRPGPLAGISVAAGGYRYFHPLERLSAAPYPSLAGLIAVHDEASTEHAAADRPAHLLPRRSPPSSGPSGCLHVSFLLPRGSPHHQSKGQRADCC